MIKKLLSFIMLFVVTFCFVSGCKDSDEEQAVLVVDGKEIVATINDVNYTADQVYGDLINSNTNAEYLYEKLEDLLIKTVIPVTDSMRNSVVNEVEQWKKNIKDSATMSGTSYKDALAAALAEEGVSTEDELIEKKLFALQEEFITNQYWSNHEDEYYINYLKNRYVYHISQILVSVSTNGNSDYFNAQPTSASAQKLYDVINALISGESFYNVALKYSDDSNSKDNGGDLGLVTLNDTSISNEVKYALASYSIYMENADLDYPEYIDSVYADGIEAIPQKYVDMLGELYSKSDYYLSSTSDTTKLESSRVYARAIIFNNLFNSKSFRLLQSDGDKNVESMDNIKMPLVDVVGFESESTQNVLVNSDGNPILVVRSNSGIHLISIQKSAFVGEEELKKYYSKEVDYNDEYKNYLEKAVNESDKTARLEKLESFANEYATMKVSGNSDFAGNSDFIRYDMFKYYLNGTYNGVKFEIKNNQVKDIVMQYIDSKAEYIQTKIQNVFDEGYEAYANLVEYSDTKIIQKEVPILSCLDTVEDSSSNSVKYMCTYTYKEGFKFYDPSGGDQ